MIKKFLAENLQATNHLTLIKISDLKYRDNYIQGKLEEKMKKYKNTVRLRQEKLLHLFESEQVEFDEELRRLKAIQALELESVTHKERMKAEEKTPDQINQEILEKKYQLFLESCDEIRPIINKLKIRNTKKDQLLQIEDQANQKKNDEYYNQIWAQFMAQKWAYESEIEKSKMIQKTLNNKQYYNDVKMQIEQKKSGKLRNKLEEIENERVLNDNIIKVEQLKESKILEKKQRKDMEYFRQLMEQINENRSKPTLTSDSHQDCGSWSGNDTETALKRKKRLLNEFLAYKKYVESLKREQADAERRYCQLLDKQWTEIQEKWDQKIKMEETKRKIQQKQNIAELKKQIDEKQQQKLYQKHIELIEHNETNKFLELAKKQKLYELKVQKEQKKAYGNELIKSKNAESDNNNYEKVFFNDDEDRRAEFYVRFQDELQSGQFRLTTINHPFRNWLICSSAGDH